MRQEGLIKNHYLTILRWKQISKLVIVRIFISLVSNNLYSCFIFAKAEKNEHNNDNQKSEKKTCLSYIALSVWLIVASFIFLLPFCFRVTPPIIIPPSPKLTPLEIEFNKKFEEDKSEEGLRVNYSQVQKEVTQL